MSIALRTSHPRDRVCRPRTIATSAVKKTGSEGDQVAKCNTCIVGDRKFVGHRR